MEKIISSAITISEWQRLSETAWNCQKHAKVLGSTRVGAAALSTDGKMFEGCNVEHRFRSHDIHAEVSAISSLVAAGCSELKAILVVAERENFTPCGGCMDWIYEMGGSDCIVGFQRSKNGSITKYLAKELMPFYPR